MGSQSESFGERAPTEDPSTKHQFGIRASTIPSSFACRAVTLAKAGHSGFVISPPITNHFDQPSTISHQPSARVCAGTNHLSLITNHISDSVPGRGLEPL